MSSGGTAEHSANGDVRRAAERVALACRALSAAANDLHVAYLRSHDGAVDDVTDQVRSQNERVCELAEELEKLGRSLAAGPLAAGAGR